MPWDKIITLELAKACSRLSHETRRQIGVLIDRRGHVQSVIIGTGQELTIPQLSRARSGLRLLRGVRLVHTHLNNHPLTKDDLTDLALLRLDLMVAIGVGKNGNPENIYAAHVLPLPSNGKSCYEWPPCSFHSFQLDCGNFIQTLESDFSRINPGLHPGEASGRAILISVSTRGLYHQDERLEELKELVCASDIQVLDAIVQRPGIINPKYVLGTGKLKDVIIQALQSGADMLIFDQDLSPGQVKGISQMTEMRVLDRTQVILDIFARRAHSRTGKIQVELAQLRYLLPRLAQSSTALSRLAGGIGARGPGETKLEMDRRRMNDRIRRLERELQAVSRHRMQQRNARVRRAVPIISIIGYTNAGKSTLLNALTGSCVSVRDRLFETLDTVSRRLDLPRLGEVVLTDTVGFIRDLPKDLLAAFHTTLHELQDADLLLHVIDAKASNADSHIEAVETILSGLQLDRIPRLMVLNKCDLIPQNEMERLCSRYQALGVSARNTETVTPIFELMASMIEKQNASGSCGFSWDHFNHSDRLKFQPVVTT